MNTSLNLTFFPKYFTQKAVVTFGILLSICSIIFFKKFLGFQWILFGLIEVVVFFYFSNKLTVQWTSISPNVYHKKLFRTSFLIRLVWVFFSYAYFIIFNDSPFEYEAADAAGYHGEAQWLVALLKEGQFDVYQQYIGKNYSDMGYPLYLGIIYIIVGNGVLIPRIIKALLGAYTCLFVYKIAKNNFGESVGRMAGILAMLLPNLIYYCGLHVKETEMVFLTVAFIYNADKLLRTKQSSWKTLFILLFLGAAMFFFRTVLAACLLASVGLAAFYTSSKVSSLSKRIAVLFFLVLSVISIESTSLGDNIDVYIKGSKQNLNAQMTDFANREGGNKLAKYGSRSIFLPFMLVAPFPTLVDTGQRNPMMLGGAFFTRNVYAFFVFIALIALYKQKQIRNHVFLLSFIFSYIFVLASSGFALSERFHLPLAPFLLIFVAYGISQMTNKNKKYYVPYLIIISLIVIGWNWFKLAGRL